MRRRIFVLLITIATGCCSGPQDDSGTNLGQEGQREAPQPSTPTPDPPPANPPPIEGVERSALITLLRASVIVNPNEFSEEMRQTLHPGRLQPLVGMTRDELVAQLGEPNGGPVFQTVGQVAWRIGFYPEPYPAHPPILVAILDAAGVVTEANFQLSR